MFGDYCAKNAPEKGDCDDCETFKSGEQWGVQCWYALKKTVARLLWFSTAESLSYLKLYNSMEANLITTSTSLEGYKIIKHLGIVRGITVRSRSIVGNIAGGFMAIFGGRSAIYTELCERAREEATQLMIRHGQDLGANAIINMRYDANEVMSGLTEVLAYGTGVVVEKIGN